MSWALNSLTCALSSHPSNALMVVAMFLAQHRKYKAALSKFCQVKLKNGTKYAFSGLLTHSAETEEPGLAVVLCRM